MEFEIGKIYIFKNIAYKEGVPVIVIQINKEKERAGVSIDLINRTNVFFVGFKELE